MFQICPAVHSSELSGFFARSFKRALPTPTVVCVLPVCDRPKIRIISLDVLKDKGYYFGVVGH